MQPANLLQLIGLRHLAQPCTRDLSRRATFIFIKAANAECCVCEQACEGLAQSGIADTATWKHLLGDEYPSLQPATSTEQEVHLIPFHPDNRIKSPAPCVPDASLAPVLQFCHASAVMNAAGSRGCESVAQLFKYMFQAVVSLIAMQGHNTWLISMNRLLPGCWPI